MVAVLLMVWTELVVAEFLINEWILVIGMMVTIGLVVVGWGLW